MEILFAVGAVVGIAASAVAIYEFWKKSSSPEPDPTLQGAEVPVLQPQEEPHREQATLRLDFRKTLGGNPLGWLEWRARLVQKPVGREEEYEDLLQWARTGPEEPRLRLLHGVGGVGKTRLAAEVALELRNEGWEAGFLKREGALDLPMEGPGTLVLVDYPEEQRDRVRELLKRFSGEDELPQHRLRILLVSRYDPDFWSTEIGDHNLGTLMDADVRLEPLGQEALFDLFQRAQQRTPREAPSPEPQEVTQEEFEAWLGQSHLHRLPLFVTAAAINSVHEPKVKAVDLSGRNTIEALALRELSRLRREGPQHGLAKTTLPRLAVLAAIAGGLDEPALKRLAGRGGEIGLGDLEPESVMETLHPTGRLQESAFPAPQPDLVAAAMLVGVLREQLSSEAVWMALELNLLDNLQSFARLSFDAEETLGLLKARPSDCLVRVFEEHPERCAEAAPAFYDAVLPPALTKVAHLVWYQAIQQTDDKAEKALLLNNLSVDLAAAGDRAGALAASREAVETSRGLASSNPARYAPELALSLTNLSVDLSDSGDREGALAAIREAVETYRGLAAANPARYAPDLASSLNNLSLRLSDSGDREGALAAIREAVETYRGLAAANPARYAPDLASSLNNLSVDLSDSGDREGALAASREAVEIRRGLALSNPARYNPEWASSLNNLSMNLSESGDRVGALAASREAVKIIEPFAAQYPESKFGQWHQVMVRNLERWQEE